jgi:hypothetical protein
VNCDLRIHKFDEYGHVLSSRKCYRTATEDLPDFVIRGKKTQHACWPCTVQTAEMMLAITGRNLRIEQLSWAHRILIRDEIKKDRGER